MNSVVQSLGASQSLGLRQQGILREAVISAIECRRKHPDVSEAEALISAFKKKNESAWNVVYQRLWSLLYSGVLNQNGRSIEAEKINIIDLSELDMLTKGMVGEMLLSWVWRMVCYSGLPKDFGGLTVVLDEFQHFSLKKDAVLRDILREGRKFKLNLILGTQTFEVFPKEVLGILNQASTHLYFRPPLQEASKLAKMIDPAQADYWRARLLNLRVGECIATGELEVNGQRIMRPLVLA